MTLGKIDLSTLNLDLFDRYHVTCTVSELAGGIPKNKDLVAAWVNAANKEKTEAERAAIVDATLNELPGLTEDAAAKGWNTFKEDDKGLYLEGRCLKAALKEAANIVKGSVPLGKNGATDEEAGITAFRSKMADQCFVLEDRVYLGKKAPDRMDEQPIHVMTAMGPRNSLKRTDICTNVRLEFTVLRLAGGGVPEKALLACLWYLQQLGVGADRSQGRGKLVPGSLEIEKTVEIEPPKVAARGKKK